MTHSVSYTKNVTYPANLTFVVFQLVGRIKEEVAGLDGGPELSKITGLFYRNNTDTFTLAMSYFGVPGSGVTNPLDYFGRCAHKRKRLRLLTRTQTHTPSCSHTQQKFTHTHTYTQKRMTHLIFLRTLDHIKLKKTESPEGIYANFSL